MSDKGKGEREHRSVRLWRGLQLWLFYKHWPRLQGPYAPEWVGTMYVELAWRFATDIGIAEAQGRKRTAIDHEERGWAP